MCVLGKTTGQYSRILSNEENKNCYKGTVVFDGTDFLSRMLGWVITLKGNLER